MVAHRDKTLPRIQKHFSESKILPRIQLTLPRIQKHFPKSKTHPRIQNNFGFWDVFCILGSVFTFWEVFVPMSHSRSGIYLWFLQWSFISLCPPHPCIWRPTALSHMPHTWCPQVPESPHTRPNVPVPFSPVPVLYTAINFLYRGVIRYNIFGNADCNIDQRQWTLK